MKIPLKNQSGILLIELVIVTVVIGIITAGVGSLFLNQLKSAYFVEDQLSKNDLKMEIQNILDIAAACNATFVGIAIPAVGAAPVPISIKDKDGNIAYSTTGVGPKNTYDRLILTSIAFTNVNILAPNTSGVIQMLVDLSRVRQGGGPSILNPLKFSIQATVDGSSNISQCGSASGPGTQLAPRPFTPGSTASCPSPATATGCSAEGEKSCVPNAAGTIFTCVSSGSRGSRCQLFCRQ